MKTLAALMSLALCTSLGGGCRSQEQLLLSSDNSGRPAAGATVSPNQEKNWGSPVSGLRLSLAIEPAVAEQTTSRRLTLIVQNASEGEIRFKPFISFQLNGSSEYNSFWAPADITTANSDFPKRVFPRPPNGQPLISLKPGESKTFDFYLEKLGWDKSQSSIYRGESFYSIVPEGSYELIGAIDVWAGRVEVPGRVVTIPKGSQARSNGIKLKVSTKDSHKLVASEN